MLGSPFGRTRFGSRLVIYGHGPANRLLFLILFRSLKEGQGLFLSLCFLKDARETHFRRAPAEQPSGLWGGTRWESNDEKFMVGGGWSDALIRDSIWSQNIPCRGQGRKQMSGCSFLSTFQNHHLEDGLPLSVTPSSFSLTSPLPQLISPQKEAGLVSLMNLADVAPDGWSH